MQKREQQETSAQPAAPAELEARAAAGDRDACTQLRRKLLRGRAVGRNYERVSEAARAGETDAFYMMRKCFLKGIGCAEDARGAVSCFENAAHRGHTSAALKLGKCFERGSGAPRNVESAAYWHRQAAARGESRAYDELALSSPARVNMSHAAICIA